MNHNNLFSMLHLFGPTPLPLRSDCFQGYTLVAVDDFWGAYDRNASNQIVGNPTQFPSGMRALGDYIHSQGLQYGLCKLLSACQTIPLLCEDDRLWLFYSTCFAAFVTK